MSAPPTESATGADLVAGLSLAGLLLPEAIAYARIAGMPPAAGLWALFAGLALYGWVGRGRTAVVTATSSSAAVLAAATVSLAGVGAAAQAALAAGLVLLTGAFFIVAGLARLGALTNLIARPVLRGFAAGLAITIIVRQAPALTGIAAGGGRVLDEAWHQAAAFGLWNPWRLGVGVAALVLLRAGARWPRLPATLVVVLLGLAASRLPAGSEPSVAAAATGAGLLAAHGVTEVGAIAFTLAAPHLPVLPREAWLRLGELALAMMFILYAESWGSIRSAALHRHEPTEPGRELFALGLCNAVSGLLGGLPVGAGFSASAANEAAGGRTRLAAWAAAAVAVAVATLLPWIAHIPEPVLAAIVIQAVGHTLHASSFRRYFRWHRDRIVSVAAVIAVLLLGVLDGLLAAVAVSLLLYLRELSAARVAELGRLADSHDFVLLDGHGEVHPVPGTLILRPEAALFFGNVERVAGAVVERLQRPPAGSWQRVVLSLEESPDLDSSCIETLAELARSLQARGLSLHLARLKAAALDALARAALPELPAAALSGLSVDEVVRGVAGA